MHTMPITRNTNANLMFPVDLSQNFKTFYYKASYTTTLASFLSQIVLVR